LAINKNKAIADAQRLAARGGFAKAAELLVQVLAEDPEDVRLWLKLGDYQKQGGSIAGAVNAYLKAANHYTERGFFLKAVACWKQILNSDPGYADGHLRLAELYAQLSMGPDAVAQYHVVAAAYEREGRAREAIGVLARICELMPDDVPSRIRLAEGHARLGDLDAASVEFRLVLDLLESRDRIDEFLQVAERLVYLAPSDLDTLRRLSGAYLRKGDAKRALARLQLVFKSTPNDIETLELLARAFTALGQTSKAVSVHREVARIHEEAGNQAGRLDAYRRLIALDPTDVEALSATGAGRAATAVREQVNPNLLFTQGITSTQGMQRLTIAPAAEIISPEAQLNRHLLDIELLGKYGLVEQAVASADKALALSPENEGALTHRKTLSLALGRRDEAINALLRLASVVEGRAPEIAMAHLGEVLQLSPNHGEASQRMQRLSLGMARGVAAVGHTAVIEAAPPDDYADLDLSALDLADGSLAAPPQDLEMVGDADGLDGFEGLDALDAFDAPAAPAAVPTPVAVTPPNPARAPVDLSSFSSFELPPDASLNLGGDFSAEDFGGLMDSPDDDFSDLLRDGPAPSGASDRQSAFAEVVDADRTPLPGDLAAFGALVASASAADEPEVDDGGLADLDLLLPSSLQDPSLDGLSVFEQDVPETHAAPLANFDDDFSDLLAPDAPEAPPVLVDVPATPAFDPLENLEALLPEDFSAHEATAGALERDLNDGADASVEIDDADATVFVVDDGLADALAAAVAFTRAEPEPEPALELPPEPGPALELPPEPEPALELPPEPELALELPPEPEPALELPPEPEPALELPPEPEPVAFTLDIGLADSAPADSAASALAAVLDDFEIQAPADGGDADDAELAEDDVELLDDFEFDEDDEVEHVASDALPSPPAPAHALVDARTELVSLDGLAALMGRANDALAEVDFLLTSRLTEAARDALDDIEREFGATDAVVERRTRLSELLALQSETERVVDQIAAQETPAAIAAASTVGELEAGDLAAHFDLGVAYMEMGQFKKAIVQLEKVVGHRERRAEALRVIGLCELQQGNASAAVARLQDALRSQGLVRDARVGLLYDLATAYETQGSRVAARQQLQSIVELGAADFLETRARLARLGG